MGDQNGEGIAWTEETWNPIRGCRRVSEGCRYCYAEGVAARFSGAGQPYERVAMYTHLKQAAWTGEIEMVEGKLYDPLRWKRARRVFVNSMSDLFYEKLEVTDVARIFAVMTLASKHTFQVLTKRAWRMRELLESEAFWSSVYGYVEEYQGRDGMKSYTAMMREKVARTNRAASHIWLGVSVEDQQAAETRIGDLVHTPCDVRWLSCEPLIGPVDLSFLTPESRGRLDWLVVGGESGAKARPMERQWATSLLADCRENGTAYFFKQGSQNNWGNFKDFEGFPEELRIREYPRG